MKIGFTGTRAGMSAEQRDVCAVLLTELHGEELHHGDAIGADAEMHQLAVAAGIPIVIHPPSNPANRACCESASMRAELPYSARNRAIVDETEILIAAPKSPEHQARRSGTWRTIRYARSAGRQVVVVWPDGRRE